MKNSFLIVSVFLGFQIFLGLEAKASHNESPVKSIFDPSVTLNIFQETYDPKQGRREITQFVFNGDASTGRAWVEVTVAKHDCEGEGPCPRLNTHNILIEGLAYNSLTGEILYSGYDLKYIECAKLMDGTFVSSGSCSVFSRGLPDRQVIDDGFRVTNTPVQMYHIFFNAH